LRASEPAGEILSEAKDLIHFTRASKANSRRF
jgi:hypothetical protein